MYVSKYLVLLSLSVLSVFGQSRFIVELNSEPVGQLRGPEAANRRARVRGEQQQIRRGLGTATVIDSVDTVANAIFVEASDDEAARIRTLPGVRRVMPVREQKLLLDRAALIHRAVDVWNLAGSEQAGRGVKIAIIDTGIDVNHPGFQDSSLPAVDSYPRFNRQTDIAFTSSKIIVARSYVNMLPRNDPDQSARDHVGHGTAVAMTAAGVRNAGPLATMTGIAPKAYLGSYKVFGTPGVNDSTYDNVVIKAIDDAVADGMDVISMSLGGVQAPRVNDDPEVQAIERAVRAGVIVVVAAGNDGPGQNTIASPGTAPSAISVGATTNDRFFAGNLTIDGFGSFAAIPAAGPTSSVPVTAPLADVAALDGSGLACDALPAGSLTGRIALILRGNCTFTSKLQNARNAGAVAGVIYAAENAPAAFTMSVSASSLPSEMIAFEDGTALRQLLAGQTSVSGTLGFALAATPMLGGRIATFSSIGPNVDLAIKPDLTATGVNMYMATQSFDANGDMYDPSGYTTADGTSFATPLVAGAAALLKSLRPGLTVDQYRSLLINGAAAPSNTKTPWHVQRAGAGGLDAMASFRSTLTASPVSLSFGAATSGIISRTLHLTNLATVAETFSIIPVALDGVGLPQTPGTVELAAGASVDVPVRWNAMGLDAGTYEGYLEISGTVSGTTLHVPYWFALTAGTPAQVTVLDIPSNAASGTPQSVLFKVLDASGVIAQGTPVASVLSGGGSVRRVRSYDSSYPGLFGLDVMLGGAEGQNSFRIQAGDVGLDVVIIGH